MTYYIMAQYSDSVILIAVAVLLVSVLLAYNIGKRVGSKKVTKERDRVDLILNSDCHNGDFKF